MKCLYYFHFSSIIKDTAYRMHFPIKRWKIKNEPLEERINQIKDEKYFKKIIEQANTKKIKYNETEIITWFDNMYLINKVFESLEFNENINIIQELNIPFSNKRADFTLFYKNKILIIEFSYNKYDTEYRYEHKLHQAISYKELLQNVLSPNIQIGTYTFLNKPNDEDIEINDEEIKNLQKFIIYFFNNSSKTALEELESIENN